MEGKCYGRITGVSKKQETSAASILKLAVLVTVSPPDGQSRVVHGSYRERMSEAHPTWISSEPAGDSPGSSGPVSSPPISRSPRPIFLFVLDTDLDEAAAARAIRAFRGVRDEKPIVWLDCSAVRSASTGGLEVLTRFAQDARAREVTFRLLSVPAALRACLRGKPLESFVWPRVADSSADQPANHAC